MDNQSTGTTMGDTEQRAALHALLRLHWGASTFRDMQLEAVLALLQRIDVLMVAPTGFGKSLVFQLPALACAPGFAVIVSPLIALAKDQKDAANDRGIDAEMWNSDVPISKKEQILRDIRSGEPATQLLYCTPEALQEFEESKGPCLLPALLEAHANESLKLLAIDEAHVVSAWGHDFRPTFRTLGDVRQKFKGVPVVAVTATATAEVKKDIVSVLGLQQPLILQGSFNRPNITYYVRHKELLGDGSEEAVMQDIIDFIKMHPTESGIIYARLRKSCDQLTSRLQDADIEASAFHAGLSSDAKRLAYSNWMENAVNVMCATIAFGMGIDKPDVRWVLHYDPPGSLEGYSQESGRSGRDGAPSTSIMYCSRADLEEIKKLEKGQRRGSVAAVADYGLQPGCFRRKLLSHFGEARGACNPAVELPCQFCSNPRSVTMELTRLETLTEETGCRAQAPYPHPLRECGNVAGPGPATEADLHQSSTDHRPRCPPRSTQHRPTWQSAAACENLTPRYRVGLSRPKFRGPLAKLHPQATAATLICLSPAEDTVRVCKEAGYATLDSGAGKQSDDVGLMPKQDVNTGTSGDLLSGAQSTCPSEEMTLPNVKRRRLGFNPPLRMKPTQ